MSESEVLSPLSAPGADVVSDEAASASAPTPARKRPKPGERREQILQALAAMLEKPGAERITTAALAAHLGVSGSPVPPLRQQGPDVRRTDRVHRAIRLHAGAADRRAGCAGGRAARSGWHAPGQPRDLPGAAVWRAQPRHGARHGGR